MKAFKDQAAQGDLLLTRIAVVPRQAVAVPRENGRIIVGHSETGHHHVIDADDAVTMYRLPEEIYEAFLVVRAPAVLRHLRGFDTHEPIEIAPGTYRVRRQRERAYVPEGWRASQD